MSILSDRIPTILFILAISSLTACNQPASPATTPGNAARSQIIHSPKVRQILAGANEQTTYTRSYDPAYVRIRYPGGDVPRETGVCADVIIRSFRRAGVDLQKEVHEDMAHNFAEYPNRWGLSAPDTNIDHRRVPNLMTFFRRKGKAAPITTDPKDYLPGDVVAWNVGGLMHIGLVGDQPSHSSASYQVVHNIGQGARSEDVLFSWPIIGHYRYFK